MRPPGDVSQKNAGLYPLQDDALAFLTLGAVLYGITRRAVLAELGSRSLTSEVDEMATGLRPETQRRVDLLFSEEERAEATRLLAEECGYNIPGPNDADFVERIRYAALKVSKGDLDRLRKAIEVAKVDFRDLLTKAGFAWTVTAHKRWMPGEEESPWWKFW